MIRFILVCIVVIGYLILSILILLVEWIIGKFSPMKVEGVSFDIAKEALRLAAQKLPVKTKFVVRRDFDKNA